jgi:hypothetical protein
MSKMMYQGKKIMVFVTNNKGIEANGGITCL